MRRTAAWIWVAVLAACSSEETVSETTLVLPNAVLEYDDAHGWIDIRHPDGRWILENATAWAFMEATSVEDRGRRIGIDASSRTREVKRTEAVDALGAKEQLEVRALGANSDVQLVWTISAYPEGGFFTFALEVENEGTDTVHLAKIVTLGLAEDDAAGLFIGASPKTHRILENGSHVYFEFAAEVRPGDTPPIEALNIAVEGDLSGNSVSNWNHAVVDLTDGTTWIAGSLSFESLVPLFSLTGSADGPQSPDGRVGFSVFAAEGSYLPAMKPIPAGEGFGSELTYVHPTEDDPLEGVEHYADNVKKHMGIRLWTEKDPDNRIPNGWNSWTGSGGTGGYGTDIDEATMLANLDVMATEFRDFGMDYFQIDDGYEPAYGDWSWREDRFPHGPRWLSDQIRERGLKPGLWIAPFAPFPSSDLVAEHPDWMADKTGVGELFSGGYALLDLTHPEVKAWLKELFVRFRKEWNFDWLKSDFAYHALMGTNFYDSTKTREEAYRDAMRIVREAVGDETFIMTVAVMGIHYGISDSDRITLDSMPVWDAQPGDADLTAQGLKPTVRTAARRYYLHDRIWINHPDLIFFRSNTRDESWPRLTFEESQAFCTFVGLTGGIVKLGDRLVDLLPEHIDTVRKLLPTYGKHARPLDLFEREFPEVWHLEVTRGLDGYDEPFHLIGLFNWGENTDLTTNPYSDIPDSTQSKQFALSLDELGVPSGKYLAYEFWTNEYLGEIERQLNYEVPAHSGRVIALRARQEHPQFLGWNRQISMGGTVLESVEWDEAAATLSIDAELAAGTSTAPFAYDVVVSSPDGFDLLGADSATLSDLEAVAEPGAVRLGFSPEQTHDGRIVVRFSRR